MKLLLRGLVYSYIALYFSQLLAKTYIVFDDKSFWMILLALALLNIFKRSMLEVVGLPSKGLLFELVSLFLTGVLLNILVAIIPNFRFLETNTPGFLVFGFVVPSTHLSAFWAGVATALVVSLVSNFLYWLSSGKK